jgi:acetyl-CoA/propionyl-CoA carboxylase carboxyl transferase subunit
VTSTTPARLRSGATVASEAPKRIKVPRDQDLRNPNFRLQALLDPGSVKLITPDDNSGMLAATGTINPLMARITNEGW